MENNQTTNYFKILNSKNRYMKIDNVFSPTKALISNGADPLGKISRNRGNQRNKKVWNAKNMVMMIKLEPKRTRTEKQCNKVQPNFYTSLRCVNDENCVKQSGALNYCYSVFLVLETRYNLIYYNSCFDAWIKIYNSLIG